MKCREASRNLRMESYGFEDLNVCCGCDVWFSSTLVVAVICGLVQHLLLMWCDSTFIFDDFVEKKTLIVGKDE